MESNLNTMKYFVRAALVAALIVAGATSHAQAQTAALQSAAFDNEITAADVTCYTFNSNLTIGSQGGDVMALQIFLAQKGFLTLPAGQTPNINSYFGRLTKAAVAKYQSTVGISSSGYVGPLTRGRINTEFACSEGSTSPVGNDSSNQSDQSSEESRVMAYAAINSAALIVGKPVIALERGINNEETSLVARFEVLVTPSLKDGLLMLYSQQNYVYFEGKAGDGGQVRSLSTQIIPGKNVTTTKDEYGRTAYVISPNTVGRLTLIGRVNTKELFAGPYRARVNQMIYARQGSSDVSFQVVNASSKTTEQVRVMGEVSPYISSVKAEPELGSVVINGVRFNTSGSNKVTLYANGSVAKAFVLRTEAGSYLSFPLSYLTSSNDGYYTITVTNESLGNKDGLSNTFGFTYKGSVGSGENTTTTVPANEGRLVDVGSDYVSSTSFSPGTGTYNQTRNDWHWAVRLVNEADRTIRSLTLITYDNNEGWSTASDVSIKAGTALPLKVMTSSFANSQVNEMIPVSKGTTVLNLWGQVESTGFSGGTLTVTYTDGSTIRIPISASDLRSGSSGSVSVNNTTQTVVPAAVSPSGITAEAHVVDVGSNYVGYWGVWQPGTGNANKTADDWHWAARITSPKTAVVKSVTITNGSEGWSTSDSAKVGGVLTYPLKFRSATQENAGPNKTITLNEGSNVINFWGQVESPRYYGGTIILTLDDGSTVTASIPASSVVWGQTSATGTDSSGSATVINLSPISLTKTVQVGQSIYQQFVVDNIPKRSDGKYGAWSSWTVSKGSLPSGLSLNMIGAFAGSLSGTPTAVGSYTFQIHAYNPTDNLSSYAWIYLTVTPATVTTQTQSTQQPASSIPPQTNAAVAPVQDSVEAHVVDAGSEIETKSDYTHRRTHMKCKIGSYISDDIDRRSDEKHIFASVFI
jgi:hypothetical protein